MIIIKYMIVIVIVIIVIIIIMKGLSSLTEQS